MFLADCDFINDLIKFVLTKAQFLSNYIKPLKSNYKQNACRNIFHVKNTWNIIVTLKKKKKRISVPIFDYTCFLNYLSKKTFWKPGFIIYVQFKSLQ